MAKSNKNLIWITAIIAVTIILVTILILTMTKETSEETITAEGYHSIPLEANSVEINLEIRTTENTANEAKDENGLIISKVISALGDLEVPYETINFQIYQDYDWSENKKVEKGWTASNTIKVTTGDFEKASQIIDSSVNQGALVTYTNFVLSDELRDTYQVFALGNASAESLLKAKAIASGVNKKVGELISITSSDFNYYPRVFEMSSESKIGSQDIAIAPKTLEVSARVVAVYSIK